MKNKKVIYTCITGGYDAPPIYDYVAPDWDYIFFSDDEELVKKGKLNHWTIKPVEFKNLDNVRNARYHKINAHLLLPEYEHSVFIDGNIKIVDKKFVDDMNALIKEDVLISIPAHPTRNCIYQEAEVLKSRKIDNPELIDKQIEFLQNQKFPENYGLFENGIIFRKHNDKNLIKAQELWWDMIENYSRRDQLSFMYCAWKNNINVEPMYNIKKHHRRCKELKFSEIVHGQHKKNSIQIIPNWLIKIIGFPIPTKRHRKKLKEFLKTIRIRK